MGAMHWIAITVEVTGVAIIAAGIVVAGGVFLHDETPAQHCPARKTQRAPPLPRQRRRALKAQTESIILVA